MKTKKLLLIIALLLVTILSLKSNSDEVKFKASNMDIKNDGNLVIAYKSSTLIPNKEIEIKSEKAEYDKISEILTFKNEVLFKDIRKNLIIKSNKVILENNKNLIYSPNETEIFVNNKFKINTKNIYFDRNSQKIYSNEKTLINDNENNIYELSEKFNFDIKNEIIKSGKSTITDKDGNKYIFEDLAINIKKNEIAGKEISVDFENSYFGNKDNDPILKGRSGYSSDNELKIYKASFSTCNINNKKCRGWELVTDEFNHDKKKRIFEYKKSWLKIFDQKIFFLPYFNHPDPTIERKSGFLTPSYSASDSLGTSINIPYFKIIDVDKDITFNPRVYSEKNFLLQNEYRQALENSRILTDFSFLVGNDGTKGHIFYNQLGKFNNLTDYELNLRQVKGDNYLKKHKLSGTSSLIKNDSLLESNLDIDWSLENSNLNMSFKVYEDLSRNYHDRYQYILPDFYFSKDIEVPESYNGKFNFSSYGHNKNYNTNVFESVVVNDFLFSSSDFVNSYGFSTDYDLLLKNTNSYSNNSVNFEENSKYNLFGLLKVDTSLPLQKRMNNFTNYLKPVLSFRYSPNGNKNISNKDLSLNYDSVFSLNRIGTLYQVEGGESLSIGIELKRDDKSGFNIFDMKFANVLKRREDSSLPTKSKLNETRSDIFGNIKYNLNENTSLNYFFSYDKDLKYSNLDQLGIDFGINNFFTNISYFIEHNDLEEKESIKNKSTYKLNNENNLTFEISKDLNENFTQYYDLIYTYETDCLSLNLNYNNTFSRDGSLEPNKSLTFLIKIIPFTELGVPNVGELISN